MVVSSSQCYSSAVERMIRSRHHGYQKEFAKRIGISQQYLSDLLSGRKSWPDSHKDRAAHELGMSVADILHVGQVMIETGMYFPYVRQVSVFRPHSDDRADWIAKRAGLDAKLGDTRFLSTAALRVWLAGTVEPYLAGRMDDATFYQDILGVSLKIIKTCEVTT